MSVIGELINSAGKESYSKAKMVNVYYKDLVVNPQNQEYHQEDIQSLAENIKEIGLLHPLVVTALNTGRYLIISGHRRYHAHKYLVETQQLESFEDILCRVMSFEDELEDLKALISSNSYRQIELKDKIAITRKAEDLYNKLVKYDKKPKGLKRDWIAQITGFSGRSIQDYLKIEDIEGELSASISSKKSAISFDSEAEWSKLKKRVDSVIKKMEQNEIKLSLFDQLEALMVQISLELNRDYNQLEEE